MLRIFIKLFVFVFAFGVLALPVSAEAAGEQDIGVMEEDLAEISDRLDKVETKSILDRVIIGGEFRTRLDYFKYEDTTASLDPIVPVAEHDSDTKDIWTNRLRLNLEADITDDLAFYGRLTYFKLWGETAFDGIADDRNHPSIPDSEGNIHVERAYLEYLIPDLHLCLTAGRLPSGEGPPGGLRENRSRKATWPKIAGDLELDGLIANLYLDEWTDLENSSIRILYLVATQNWLEHRGLDMEGTRAPSIVFETQVPNIENSLMLLSHTMILDLAPLPNVPGMTVVSIPDELGEVSTWVFHIQFNDINEDGLDCFLTYGYSDTDPSSDGTVFLTPPMNLEVGLFGDNLNGNLGESRTGNILYTGIRYELPIEDLKHPKVGFEYNHGSKYWMSLLNTGGGELINKLLVHGDAYELYYIQPIEEKNMFLRVGCIYMDYDYENPLIAYGSMADSNMTITNAYLLMDVLF